MISMQQFAYRQIHNAWALPEDLSRGPFPPVSNVASTRKITSTSHTPKGWQSYHVPKPFYGSWGFWHRRVSSGVGRQISENKEMEVS